MPLSNRDSRKKKSSVVPSSPGGSQSESSMGMGGTSSAFEDEDHKGEKVKGNDEYLGVPTVPGVTNVPSKPESKPKKWGDLLVRALSAVVMVSAFGLVIYGGHVCVMALVLCIQSAFYHEIVNLRVRPEKERKLKNNNFIRWYFFFCMLLYGHGRALSPQLLRLALLLSSSSAVSLVEYHELVCFVLYSLGIVLFVVSLRKGFFKYQFGAFAWTHMTLVLVILQTSWMSANIFRGLIWFVLPSSLVVINDITAYLCGRAMGKTQLIAISPKKTWEGFIGATFCTITLSIILVEFMCHSDHLICPKQSLDFAGVTCVTPPEFQYTDMTLPYLISSLTGIQTINMRPMHVHGMVVATFASVIGPFGGLFASGLKRALKKKDFGDLIPGHGGITDRFDCQVLMAAFMYFYCVSVVRGGSASVVSLWHDIVHLSDADQLSLYHMMASHLQAKQAL